MSVADVEAHLKRIVKPNAAKILTIDIERLPGLARVWQPRTKYVPPQSFVEWPRLLCFAARWYGKKRPIFEAEWIDRDRMIERSWELYNEADIVVTFNGRRFDNKHLRSDWLLAGMPPPAPWKDIDLFVVARQFGFESKSLDSLTRRLGRGGKALHYNADLAFAAVEGDREAQRLLREYNVGDVELTDWLADRLRPWTSTHPHIGTAGDEKRCNACGSENLTLLKSRYRAVVMDYALYRCECGALVRGGWVARVANTRGVA